MPDDADKSIFEHYSKKCLSSNKRGGGMKLLRERVALITGAGGGIGRGVALSFAKAGAAVVVAELDEQSGTAVAQELKALGARALFVKTDVFSKEDIEAAIQASVDELGGLDVLVNNAFAP